MRHTCFISYILQAELRLNTPYEAARNKVRNIWPGGHIQSTHTPVTTTEVNANFTKISHLDKPIFCYLGMQNK